VLILLVPRSMLTRAASTGDSKSDSQAARAMEHASGSTLPMTER
jgi:hypothetical protein